MLLLLNQLILQIPMGEVRTLAQTGSTLAATAVTAATATAPADPLLVN